MSSRSDTEQDNFEHQVLTEKWKALERALEGLVCHTEARFNTISTQS